MSRNTHNNKQFNLSELVNDLAQIALKLGLQKNIEVNIDIKPNIKIYGDEGKITRALLNIIDNAIKYTKNSGLVSILLEKTSTEAIINIKDNGMGISKVDLEHIFERFYRGSKTAKTVGSGLGLAIGYGIIKAHNGSIKISSKVGIGTLVEIDLPISFRFSLMKI